jgi:hypothetical protein
LPIVARDSWGTHNDSEKRDAQPHGALPTALIRLQY